MGLDSEFSPWSTRATRISSCRQLRFLRCHWLGHDPVHQGEFEKAISASDPHRPYLPGLSHGLQFDAGDPDEPCSFDKPHPASPSAKRIQASDKDRNSALVVEPRSPLGVHELRNTALRLFHDIFRVNEVGRTSLSVIACNGLETGRHLLWLCS
jgi:hypothetical protein